MEKPETEYAVDKSRYPQGGPWHQEPDHLEWRDRGYPCMMFRHHYSGHWCGYVGVPPGHPWHGQRCNQPIIENIDVHGTVTYTGTCQGHICHVPLEGEDPNVWWVGFDMAHGSDYSPGLGADLLETVALYPSLAISYAKPYGEYRDVTYVRNECHRVVTQAIAAITNP